VVLSFAAEEAWDALLGVKTAEAGTTTAVAGGGALCFLLTHPASPTVFLFLICNQIFVTCISPSQLV
jgi:hypothetical protein